MGKVWWSDPSKVLGRIASRIDVGWFKVHKLWSQIHLQLYFNSDLPTWGRHLTFPDISFLVCKVRIVLPVGRFAFRVCVWLGGWHSLHCGRFSYRAPSPCLSSSPLITPGQVGAGLSPPTATFPRWRQAQGAQGPFLEAFPSLQTEPDCFFKAFQLPEVNDLFLLWLSAVLESVNHMI